jgi:hypothetical protein
MKIQQMAFMIVAVFFFFILVGLFFLGITFKDVEKNAAYLEKEQTISSLKVITDMPELSFGFSKSMAVDEDKLRIMVGNFSSDYDLLWPVASVGVYKFGSGDNEMKKCPGADCNYYEVYDNGQSNVKTYSTFISICNRLMEGGSVYDKCEIGKLIAGVKIQDE